VKRTTSPTFPSRRIDRTYNSDCVNLSFFEKIFFRVVHIFFHKPSRASLKSTHSLRAPQYFFVKPPSGFSETNPRSVFGYFIKETLNFYGMNHKPLIPSLIYKIERFTHEITASQKVILFFIKSTNAPPYDTLFFEKKPPYFIYFIEPTHVNQRLYLILEFIKKSNFTLQQLANQNI
jgi:hypothetical protein